MQLQDIIRNKRDGHKLSEAEVRAFVSAVVDGSMTEGQICALLMAIFWRGMDLEETTWLTDTMMRSGEVADLQDIPGPKVDKHSTGGVGDKISLVLAPMVAACGVLVPMISGRGLGHTGGTLDKLESIPGFRVQMELEQYRRQLAQIGVALIGQSKTMVPADRILYALRDVTATVESIPLICASILSKKLAEGIDALVLDIKCGRGAFMPTLEQARQLGQQLVDIGNRLGKPTEAVLTAMDEPLGNTAGNALEVIEVLECLRGNGPADVMEVTFELGARMLLAGGVEKDQPAALLRCREAIDSGSAMECFRKLVIAQGGDPHIIEDATRLPTAPVELVVTWQNEPGFVESVDALQVGRLVMALGGGRSKQTDTINPSVGVSQLIKTGTVVERGTPCCVIHANTPAAAEQAAEQIRNAIAVSSDMPACRPLILETIKQ
jgi:pyrimidine-nucleoside phosphorylase